MVSIIIPNFNRESLIGETIQSLCLQSYREIEILVIDDHSSDNSEDIVLKISKEDSRVKWIKRPDFIPKGGNSCRNFGFDISRGKFVKWLDSDDLLDISCLETQVNDLNQSNADLSICEAYCFNVSSNGVPVEITNPWGDIHADSTISNYLLFKFKWHTGAGLWRKSFFKSFPIWEIGLTNSQEWLMHLKQLGIGLLISKIKSPLVYVRIHKENMSNKTNKGANYFFNECKARMLSFRFLDEQGISISSASLIKITRQFFWYHLFIVYKKGFIQFFIVFGFYKVILKYKVKNLNGRYPYQSL